MHSKKFPSIKKNIICKIRRAKKSEAGKIQRLLAKYAEKKLLLPRSRENIEKNISSFKVAEKDGKIIGCCAVKDYGNALFEIRSLAVEKTLNGKGIGTKLVKRWISALKKKNARKIFALTYRPSFFEKIGFEIVSKELFPEKIWADCINCSKKDNCDEIAVLMKI
ncbi:MAG TPA: N-acetyltransferase [Victivallales bacterium]|nr:N-acetyltransferase [Victivallales bacterium]